MCVVEQKEKSEHQLQTARNRQERPIYAIPFATIAHQTISSYTRFCLILSEYSLNGQEETQGQVVRKGEKAVSYTGAKCC